MAFVGEAKFISNLVHPHIAVSKSGFHQFKFVLDNILLHTFPSLFFEVFTHISWGDVEGFGYLFSFKVVGLVDIKVDVVDHLCCSFRLLSLG